MSTQYKVAAGRSFINPVGTKGRDVLLPGDIVSKDLFRDQAEIDRHINAGYLVPVGGLDGVRPEEGMGVIPSEIDSADTLRSDPSSCVVETFTEKAVEEQPEVIQQKSVFMFDPELLADKTTDQMAILIKENTSDFSDEELGKMTQAEMIDILSMDFEGKPEEEE